MIRIITILSFLLLCSSAFSHSVQVAWCQNCQGFLRLYVEHWHGGADPGSTTMTIEVTVNGVTTTQTGSPVTNTQGITIDELPECATPPTVFAGCGRANTENDWVTYDFPNVPTDVPVEITIISGNTVFTQDCDGSMYPASTGTFTLNGDLQSSNVNLPSPELCQGETFDPSIFNDSLPSPNYSWTNDNTAIGLPAAGDGPIPPFEVIGSVNTEVANISIELGCNTIVGQIIVKPNPRPNFNSGRFVGNDGDPLSGKKCVYDSVPFSNTSSTSLGTISNYEWDFGNGQTLSNVQNPKVKYNAAGTYDVELRVENSLGCLDTLRSQVVVSPRPTAIIRSAPECSNIAVQFRDSSYTDAPDFIDGYNLDFGDGSPNETLPNPAHLYAASGNYTITYDVVSNMGCRDTVTQDITVFNIPNASFTNTTVCENQPATVFTDNSGIASGFIVEWNWEFDDDNNNLSNLTNPSHAYSEDGVYNVKLVVRSNNGCLDEITRPVTVNAKPTSIFLSDITDACRVANINFFDYTLPNSTNTLSWSWDFGDGQTSTAQAPIHVYENESNLYDTTFDVTLITVNDLGCSDTVTVEDYITVYHKPVSAFTVEPGRTDMYNTEVSTSNLSIGADFYSWNFENGYNETGFEEIYTYVDDSSRYLIQLAVETQNGCKDTSSFLLVVDPVVSIYVPNTFTPDGDGKNDVFIFKEFGILEESVRFLIYDRWGNKIHDTDRFKPWDGTINGEDAQQDTYVYRILYTDANGEKGDVRGHVNLIR